MIHTLETSRFCLECGVASDAGNVRAENQDAFLADLDTGLFLVSDGMGGAQAGALASQMVVNVLPKMITSRLTQIGTSRNRAIRYWLRKEILNEVSWWAFHIGNQPEAPIGKRWG